MITACAIKCNGKIYLGRGHANIMDSMYAHYRIRVSNYRTSEGFMTDKGEYLSRYQAYEHATYCGQISMGGSVERALISNWVWKDLDTTFKVLEDV